MLRDVNSGVLHPFGDQRRARERAANYFTLFEILKKSDQVKDAWARATTLLDISAPIGRGAAAAIARLDLDDETVIENRKRVANSFNSLRETDLILELGFDGYPSRLAQTADAPQFIFVRQESNVLDQPSISIVGTRSASADGMARARKLAHLLSKRGITIASGLAKGIDQAAHRGAIEIGGTTIAVIGTPLTKYYPKEHQALQDQIGFVGAVVSQFYPGSQTLPLCFPLRNATMSGLSLGTVVIEASQTSGALIQARKALEQGRKVFIPRSAIDNAELKWPAQLREKGAHVFTTIDDLLEVLDSERLIPPPISAEALRANAFAVNVS